VLVVSIFTVCRFQQRLNLRWRRLRWFSLLQRSPLYCRRQSRSDEGTYCSL